MTYSKYTYNQPRYINNVDVTPGVHRFYYGTRFGHQEGSKHDFISAMRQAHRQHRIISEDKDFYGYGADSIRMIAMTYEVFE